MRLAIFLVPFFLLVGQLQARPQVYDCFIFCHEIEILDMRLHELDEVVDKFVIVESVETFRGNPKPLFFAQNAKRFEKFAHKIIHVVKTDRVDTPHPMRREIRQREYILEGLKDCDKNDIVLISDVDEIPKASEMPTIIENIASGKYEAVGIKQQMHKHFLNTPHVVTWIGTVATTYEYLLTKNNPQGAREERGRFPSVGWGWHFSSQGGIDMVIYKMQSYAHWEDDNPSNIEKTKREYAENSCIVPVIPVDDSFPQYMQDNEDYLASLGYIYRPWLGEEPWNSIWQPHS